MIVRILMCPHCHTQLPAEFWHKDTAGIPHYAECLDKEDGDFAIFCAAVGKKKRRYKTYVYSRYEGKIKLTYDTHDPFWRWPAKISGMFLAEVQKLSHDITYERFVGVCELFKRNWEDERIEP